VRRASLAAGQLQRVDRRCTAVELTRLRRTSKEGFQRVGIKFSPVAKWAAPERAKCPIVTALPRLARFPLRLRLFKNRKEAATEEWSALA
jgi:hypothetical protein